MEVIMPEAPTLERRGAVAIISIHDALLQSHDSGVHGSVRGLFGRAGT